MADAEAGTFFAERRGSRAGTQKKTRKVATILQDTTAASISLRRSSGRIASKHGWHATGNWGRHGSAANRLQHHLQVERLFAHSKVVVENSKCNRTNGSDENVPEEAPHLRQEHQDSYKLPIAGVYLNENP